MPLSVSVAVATWQRKALLEQVVRCLEDQSIPRDQYQIIICDSDSADGTADTMAGICREFGNVRYVNPVANNLAAKRNEGIRQAAAPIVVFLDDDEPPAHGFLEAHLRVHEGREGVVFCGQIRFPKDWVARSNYFRFRDSRHLGPTRPDIDSRNIPYLMMASGNLSFKKDEILRRVGLVSEEFHRYAGEDHEFAYRICEAGIRIEYAPDALAYHREANGSIAQYVKKMFIASRDSAPLLHRLAPGSDDTGLTRHLEPIRASDGPKVKCTKFALRLMINPLFGRGVQIYLAKTDRLAWLYSPIPFRYLAAYAYLQGVKDRKTAGKPTQAQRGNTSWF